MTDYVENIILGAGLSGIGSAYITGALIPLDGGVTLGS